MKSVNTIELGKGFANVKLEVAIFKEGDITIAFSPALDVSGQGDTTEEAIHDLQAVVNITIEWAVEHETIHDLLFDLGWTLKEKPKPEYMPPLFDLNDIKSRFNLTHVSHRSLSLA